MLKRLFIFFTIGAFCVISLTIAGLTLPTGSPDSTLFSAAKGATRSDDVVWDLRLHEHSKGDFLIRDGRLYLRIQTIHHHFIDDTVSRIAWTPQKLAELLHDHPEIASYLPDSGKPDGGIAWLQN
jgi:hypothetical protein